jgi:plastocyanin
MFKKYLVLPLLMMILFWAGGSQAQQTLQTLSLSPEFTRTAGTPRVTRNGFKKLWVAVWRQQGSPSKLVGRVIQSNGALGPAKVLASGVTEFEGAFDISYDHVKYTYLMAFETTRGLQVQFLNQNFVKTGAPVLIEAGASNTSPRLAYDAVDGKYLLFYVTSQDGTPRRILRSRALDSAGKPLAAARDLKTAAAGKDFGFFSVSTSPKSGNLMAMIMHNPAGAQSGGELIGFSVKPDGSLLKPAPLRFQPPTAGLSAQGDAGFADDGTGFAVWPDRTALKFRKINATMGFAGGTKSITGAADSNSVASSLVFDLRNNQYLAVWTRANQVVSTALNTSTGAVVEPAFGVADSGFTHARNAATSYDASVGNALVVWEDSTTAANAPADAATKFRVRAAIFFVGGAASTTTVTVGDNFFSPNQLSVKAGTTVRWVFSGNNPHTVTSSSGNMLDSGNLNRGDIFEFRFTTPGTFDYFCVIHGQSMSGRVIVTAENEPNPRY